MKQFAAKRILMAGIALLSVPALLFAQNEKEAQKEQIEKAEKDSKKDVQQITIIRKGDKDKKTVIEIRGDKVTVNGKDASKNGDVTVHLNDLSELRNLTYNRIRSNGDNDFNFNYDNDDFGNGNISLFSEDANRAMLGVVTDEDEDGAKITSITKESGADKAGLKAGDVITKIGDEEIKDADDVSTAVRAHKPGDKVVVSILRDGKEQKINAELGKWKGIRINNLNATIAPMAPVSPARPFNGYAFNNGGAPKLGLSVQDTDDGKGVKVLQVAGESNAAKAGLKKDDVITQINDDDVNTTDEVVQAMRDARGEPSVKLQVLRDGKTQTIDVRIPRKLKTADL